MILTHTNGHFTGFISLISSFSVCSVHPRYLYELDQHLDRILRSASMAKIDIPFDRESIRRILIQTVSASKCKTGSLRYWLSAGPGDFQLSSSGCHQPALYAIVIQDLSPFNSKGVKVVTSSIPIKPPQFATMKSVNYLPNVLSKMEAEEKGAFAAIWLDRDGFIAEGPNMNVAFVTKEKELVMPQFDKILSGCTARRVLVLAEGLVREGKLRGVRTENVTVEEGKKADEMMLIGSGILVRPVVQWDEQVIGDGKNFSALCCALVECLAGTKTYNMHAYKYLNNVINPYTLCTKYLHVFSRIMLLCLFRLPLRFLLKCFLNY